MGPTCQESLTAPHMDPSDQNKRWFNGSTDHGPYPITLVALALGYEYGARQSRSTSRGRVDRARAACVQMKRAKAAPHGAGVRRAVRSALVARAARGKGN